MVHCFLISGSKLTMNVNCMEKPVSARLDRRMVISPWRPTGFTGHQVYIGRTAIVLLYTVLCRADRVLMLENRCTAQEEHYGRARVHTQWGDDEDAVKEAVDMCPVDCISFVSAPHTDTPFLCCDVNFFRAACGI